MPLFSRNDYAAHCGIKSNALRTYISRGKVIESNDGFIDSSNSVNKIFHSEKQVKKGLDNIKGPVPAVRANTPKDKNRAKQKEDTREPAPVRQRVATEMPADPYTESMRLQKKLDAEKRKMEIEIMQLKADKMRGEVVPSNLIRPVIMQHNQHLVNDFKNAGDEMIRLMAKLKGFSGAETAKLKGDLINIINDSIKKATNSTLKSIQGIVDLHSESRGKGERL